MSEIKEYIEKIVNDGTPEDMYKLSDMLENLMKELEYFDKDCYKKYKMELHKIAYGSTFDKNMAKEIVENMKPYAEKWDLDKTRQIQSDYGLNDINPYSFYIVLNSAYNDYKDIFNEDVDMYVRFAIDFIKDEDAKKDKVYIYFSEIPM